MNKLFPFLLFTLIFVGQFFTVKNYLELKNSRIKTNTIEHKKDTVIHYKYDTINHYILLELMRKQLSELATIYKELPAHRQKQATDYIKMVTGKSRGTVWNWTRGNSRISFESIENQIIKYMKGLQNDTTGIN